LAHGFPDEGDPGEYTTYFQKIFGEDRERQRQYISAMLSEDKVTLSIGNRVLGALLATGRTRVVFTTNFDTVVERAVAEVSGRSLTAYHLEGAASANNALSNDEFPFYCKLHGDFRYDSIKNLQADLAKQNDDLLKAMLNAANRFGFIVSGYSGRDDSVMGLFRSALKTHNPFPHGFFWTTMKGARILPAVTDLIEEAREAGVKAELVEVETFDALMLRLWRNIDDKEAEIDAKVKKSRIGAVSIPLPAPGKGSIIRMNAVPIGALPIHCQALSFRSEKEWTDLRAATSATKGQLLFTKADSVLCWGLESLVTIQFKDVRTIAPYDLSAKIADIQQNLQIKGFLEEALCHALVRDKPLLTRSTKSGSYLIADAHSDDQSAFQKLYGEVGKPFGKIAGMFTSVNEFHPDPEQIHWSEAVRISIEFVDGLPWLLIDPDVWIWPPRARRDAAKFLDERRGDRYNGAYNAILDAWFAVLFGEDDRPPSVMLTAFDSGTAVENPSFSIGTGAAYSRRLAS
jgi:hypothetical protein